MSGSKGSKRISVFDRLGPGNDEPQSATAHRRYSSDKHATTSANQDKSRGHTFSGPASSSHLRIEDREASTIRDRKSRHRGSMGDFAGSDQEPLEEKRPSNPPPMKSSSETLKSVGVKVPRPPPALGSGDSDYDSGDEGKRRKGYRGDHDIPRRSKHDAPEEDPSRRSRGKDKHTDRAGTSSSRHRSPPSDATTSKSRSRRDAVTVAHDHKRRKEEEAKALLELGHKRKREYSEDLHLPEVKRARHSDHRDSERHHGKESDYLRRQDPEQSSRRQHRSRSPKTPVPSGGGERERGKGSGKGHKSSSSSSSRDTGRKTTEKEHNRNSETAKKSKGLDWSTVNDFTEKANTKLNYHPSKSVLERFTPAAVLMGTEISPLLAGPDLFDRIVELVRVRSKTTDESNLSSYWAEILEGSDSLSTPRTALDGDKTVSKSLGPCRRALTASDDYNLRRILRKDDQHRGFIGPVRSVPNNWATEHYQVALDYYQTIPTKPSGKPAYRIQASKVGTLVL